MIVASVVHATMLWHDLRLVPSYVEYDNDIVLIRRFTASQTCDQSINAPA